MRRSVALVGESLRTPVANDSEAMWEVLEQLQPGQRPVQFGEKSLDALQLSAVYPVGDPGSPRAHELFGASPAAHSSRLLFDTVSESGAALAKVYTGTRTTLFAATSLGGIVADQQDDRPPAPENGRLSTRGYHGPAEAVGRACGVPALTVNNACASANQAVGLAYRAICAGHCDAALVAAYDLLSPFVVAGFHALGALDPLPSRPFQEDRAGLNLGEAVACIALVAEDVRESAVGTYPQLLGFGAAGDAHHLTRPHPRGAGIERAAISALEQAALSWADIDAVSVHGTGTWHNDAMEQAFLRQRLNHGTPLHASKPLFGHTLGASGMVDLLSILLMQQRKSIPGAFSVDSGWPGDSAPGASEAAAGTWLSLSSGFAGSNAALIIGSGR